MLTISDFRRFCQLGPRENQEDYCLPAEAGADTRILVLCDGMGGHGHGEVASKTVAEAVSEYLTGLNPAEYTAAMLQRSVEVANEKLAQADVYNDARSMGTTLVIVALNSDHLLIGHIGDSRCYVFDSEGAVVFRTADHSLVGQAVAAGILSEEEAFTSPRKNVITRCVMAGEPTPKLDVDRFEPCDGDSVMLCSDGVSDCLRDSELTEVLRHGTDALQQYCGQNSKDNNTMMMVRFAPTGRKRAAAPEAPAAAAEADTAAGQPDTREIRRNNFAGMLRKPGGIVGLVVIALAIGATVWMLARKPSDKTPDSGKAKTERVEKKEPADSAKKPRRAEPEKFSTEGKLNNPDTGEPLVVEIKPDAKPDSAPGRNAKFSVAVDKLKDSERGKTNN